MNTADNWKYTLLLWPLHFHQCLSTARAPLVAHWMWTSGVPTLPPFSLGHWLPHAVAHECASTGPQGVRNACVSHYSAALLIPFDRRWLISFMAFVLMTQTYKRLLKLKWGLQKLKWLIFDCCRKTNHLRYIWTDPVSRPSFRWCELFGQFTFNKRVNPWKGSITIFVYKHLFRFKPAIVLSVRERS